MKIAMVTTWAVRCGIFTYSRNLSNALAKLGHEVYIIRIPRFGKKSPQVFFNAVEGIPPEVDLVHVQHEYGLLQTLEMPFYQALRQNANKPVVTTMHSIGNWEVDGIIGTNSDALIVHNEACFGRSMFPEKTTIIQHGAQPAMPAPARESKQSLGIHPDTPVVGYVGFISPQKGLETLIEAMALVPKAGLLIGGGYFTESGQTEYMTRLKAGSFEVLPKRVHWFGYVSDEDLARVYGAIDLVVYPSRVTSESGALLMALSHGKAVIASNLAPFREKERLGALQTFKDADDLAQRITLLLEGPEERARLEAKAREYVDSVRWFPNIAKRHEELYASLLRKA